MIACFTGHRPPRLGGYNENNPTTTFVKDALHKVVLKLQGQGVDTWETGGALGTDTWSAEIVQDIRDVLRLPAKHILVRPYSTHGQDGHWPKSSEDRYLRIMNKADEVVVVCTDPKVNVNRAMILRDHRMVDTSQITVAVWDGEANGGTYLCVQYSNLHGHRLVRINPFARTITGL
jgi:uncharacterized phage-like protein YoqJ